MLEAVSAGNYPAFEALCEKDNFGCRILSAYKAFPHDPALTTLTVLEEGRAVAALSLRGGSAVLCGAYRSELTDCLRFLGYKELFAPPSYGRTRRLTGQCRGPVAALKEPGTPDPALAARIERIDAETLREIYPVITADLPEITNQPFGPWYVELSHRLRHKNARIVAIRENGAIVSTAMTAAESPAGAVIGFVPGTPGQRLCLRSMPGAGRGAGERKQTGLDLLRGGYAAVL